MKVYLVAAVDEKSQVPDVIRIYGTKEKAKDHIRKCQDAYKTIGSYLRIEEWVVK